MSDSLWKPPVYGVQGREIQWLNNTVQAHEIFCGCNNAALHFIQVLAKKSTHFGLEAADLTKIQQCLFGTATKETQTDSTGETEDENTGPEGNLDFGDLEKLFEDDGTFEEPTTG